MKKEEIEKSIYERLDAECRPHSTPIPHKVMDQRVKPKFLGFFSTILSKAFDEMRESKGKTDWKFDCSFFLREKVSPDTPFTKNKLRKYLLELLQFDWIESIDKVGDSPFVVKINVVNIFSDMIED